MLVLYFYNNENKPNIRRIKFNIQIYLRVIT